MDFGDLSSHVQILLSTSKELVIDARNMRERAIQARMEAEVTRLQAQEARGTSQELRNSLSGLT